MNLKRFVLAITAVAMLSAVVASSAFAEMKAEGEWYLGTTAPGTTLAEGSTQGITCSNTANLVLTGTVGESPSTPVTLEASGITCSGAIIKNVSAHGEALGKLKFTGVKVTAPATGCTVAGETVETSELKAKLYKDTAQTTQHAFVKFEPVSGNFATVEILGTCAAAGSRIVKGSVFGESSNATSVPAATQGLVFSTAIDSTAGSALKFAGNEAHLAGTVNNSLTSGGSFNAH